MRIASPNIIENWEHIKNLKDKNNPFNKENFNIRGYEVGIKSPCIQYLENIIIKYIDFKILIEYNEKDYFKAYMLTNIIIGDPFFLFEKIEISNKIYYLNKEKENEIGLENEEIWEKLWIPIKNSNKILIYPKNKEDFYYNKNICFYFIYDNKPDNYYLYKELDRWQNINKI